VDLGLKTKCKFVSVLITKKCQLFLGRDKFAINGTETQFDLTDLQDGNYIAVIQADGQQSNAIKFILQR
jgi:hypothetical protein